MGAAFHRAGRDAKQFGYLGHRPVLFVHQPPHLTFRAAVRPQGRDRHLKLGPRHHGLGRVGVLPLAASECRELGGDSFSFRRSPAAEQERGLAAGDAPQPAAADALRPVAARAAPGRQEGLLQHILHVGRGQQGAQPDGQPRCVPAEQVPQSGVVADRYPGDQLVVIHRPSIASRAGPVHLRSVRITCLPAPRSRPARLAGSRCR